jgi:hypothetical protein
VVHELEQQEIERNRTTNQYTDFFRERFYITHHHHHHAVAVTNSESTEDPISKARLILQKRIMDKVVGEYGITDSTPLSTDGFYKTCTFELHGYIRTTSKQTQQRKQKHKKLKIWKKKCSVYQWRLVKSLFIPVSTLCLTALFIFMLLQNVLPYFNSAHFSVQKNPNLIDYWRILNFSLISIPLLFFGICLAQQHAKSIIMFCLKQQQSLPSIFFCWMCTWGYIGVYLTFFLTTLRLMFPMYLVEDETGTLPEGIQFLGLRQFLNRNLVILAPLLTAMLVMNVVTPLFQTFITILQHYNNRTVCLRKLAVSLIHYALCAAACGTLIYVMFSVDNKTPSKSGGGPNRFLNVVFYLVLFAVGIFAAILVGSVGWGFVKFIQQQVPAAKKRNMSILAAITWTLLFISMLCCDVYLILMQLRSRYLMAPMIPVPTLLCATFYLSLAMFKYYAA